MMQNCKRSSKEDLTSSLRFALQIKAVARLLGSPLDSRMRAFHGNSFQLLDPVIVEDGIGPLPTVTRCLLGIGLDFHLPEYGYGEGVLKPVTSS
jgi:hypothetical protein